jgi:IS5 family transposase
MREKQETSPELFKAQYDAMEWVVKKTNPLYVQLQAIDKLLDEMPDILTCVHEDMAGGAGKRPLKSRFGRPVEITSEQALRCAILKQLRGYTYRELTDEIEVTPIYRKFTRFFGNEIPHFTTIERMIKLISDESFHKANEAVAALGIKKKVEDGKAIRHDTTVVETDIVYPVDSRLLNDSVRVLTRCMWRLVEAANYEGLKFCDRTRRSKKRAYQIVVGKGKNIEQRRLALYRDLLKVQKEVVKQASALVGVVHSRPELETQNEVMACVSELERLLPLARQAYDQAWRRVINGEAVPASEKLFSIFETHTDIICRGKKGSPAEFGHKVDFAMGKSGLVTRYEVFEGNPGDNEVLERALADHEKRFGNVPEKLTADRRYFSAANEQMAADKGVKKVAIAKPGRLSKVRQALQRQPWFRQLMRWRAGIEGCLSTLLRSFGLKRCLWKGWKSFKAYVGVSVLTYNLRLLAGHLLKT